MPPYAPVAERIKRHIEISSTGCWLWTSQLNEQGYGKLRIDRKVPITNGRWVLAHRISYELRYGSIPKGLEIDHLCRVPRCINPEHLEAVTHQENTRRGLAGKLQASRTHCPKGHPLSGDNLFVGQHPSGSPHRQCKTCRRDCTRRYRARKKAQ